jgi:integrase
MDIDDFLASSPYAETTRESYRRVLSQLVLLDLENLTAAGLIAFVSRDEWGSSMRYVSLCACRRYITWLYGMDHPALTARVKTARVKPQRVMSAGVALELLASFDVSTGKGCRDLAMAALLLDTGLRCSEICRLKLVDVNLAERSLQVIVKGGQWARAVFSEQTALYIQDWLQVRSSSAPALFTSTRGGGQLTREGFKKVVRDWGLSIGIRLSPHDFRRTFATLATVFGAPSRVVQAAGRWSTIEMVERYTASIMPEQMEPYFPVKILMK